MNNQAVDNALPLARAPGLELAVEGMIPAIVQHSLQRQC